MSINILIEGDIINSSFSLNIKIKLSLIIVITAFVVIIMSLSFSFMFFEDYLVKEIDSQAEIIFESVVSDIKYESFNINENNSHFSQEKIRLQDIRSISGASSLYTITYSKEKEPVYVITSFDNFEREKTRIGTKVEDSLLECTIKALDGENVRVNNLLLNDKSIVLYMYPIKDAGGENVIGALGLEFNISVIKGYVEKAAIIYMPITFAVVVIVVLALIFIFNKGLKGIIEQLAYTDSLTMLSNRLAYEKHLDLLNEKINENIGSEFKIFISVFDINDLRIVNDTFGSENGDKYIKLIADAVYESFKEIGKVYRTSGDEFAVIAENCTEDKFKLCFDKYEEMEKKINSDNPEFKISAVYGYSCFINESDNSIAGAVKRADEKLSRKKKEKKNKSLRVPR